MKLFYNCLFSLLYVAISYPQEIELVHLVSGFNSPLELKHAGDDRLFVVEQGGIIKIISSDGTINPSPFLDISSSVSSGGERGLLGLAFHPEYQTNGFFYVYYINSANNTQISRFSVSSDPDIADPTSELQILSFNQPYSNHNGGHLAFGPDGMLYVSSGDGGSSGDPLNNSQSLTTYLGKILRLNVDASAPYIPTDNPFVSNSDALDEIWAYGVRNPWKFSFDSETGDLWIADVGQNSWEEINKESSTSAGLNYGWRCYEGNHEFNLNNCPPIQDFTFPLTEYSNAGTRCSITGGYVYRGTNYPVLEGLYFFADLCSDEIGTVNEYGELTFHGTFGISFITSFGVGNDNEMYVIDSDAGGVYKIIDDTLMSDPEFEITDSISIYPNPTRNLLNINSASEAIQNVEIISLSGSVIETYKSEDHKNLQIDISNIQSGLYLIKVLSINSKPIYKKLIIN